MKAFVFDGPGKLLVKDIPKPKAREGEVVFKPLYTGICFTDRYTYDFEYNYTPGTVLGHEASGEIVEIGPGVEGLKVGDRVAIDPRTYCGECNMCRAGLMTACERMAAWTGINAPRPGGGEYHGAMAEYTVTPAYTCFKIPDTMSDVAAACIEAMCCGMRIVRDGGMVLGDNVVILGGDDYSSSTLRWAKHAGAKVILADPVKIRRDVAKNLGADMVIDPTTTDVVKTIQELMPYGPDIVTVSAETYVPGSMKYLSKAVEMVRMQGKIIHARGYVPDMYQDINAVLYWYKECTYQGFGQFFGEEPWRGGKARGDFQVTIDKIAAKEIDGESHVTAKIPFDSVKTDDDLRDIMYSYPEKEAKILFKIWGK